MKRDMDLVRAILLELERAEGYASHPFLIDGQAESAVGFHCHLMLQAGLITGQETTAFGDPSPSAMPLCITWEGYEFLEAARSATLWGRAKTLAASTGNSSFKVLIDSLAQLAITQIRGQIGI